MKTIINLQAEQIVRAQDISVERSRYGDGVFMRVPRTGQLTLTREQAAQLADALYSLAESGVSDA
ncbi:hypothetical protein [Corynebacterium stationis]|uniref:hypothetical protein n=1 Tax=Corynebacterium stationis TaxID=1705 RepID=UPI00076F60D1|nr:hypothetical protein [Corynebacterium stationis]AMJ45481.1 hypothetical protein AW169_11960 [Corynebacterium stationis]AQX71934.1 hypothetical protein CA21670_11175 [Corynebacterium stationis]ASJ19615.1 hypothetical protein BA700_11940 [Corynebacterium stationis]HJG63768.1 hypothetical protein [Corynebacterium stationis]